jgi:hypothetical protein
LAIRRATVSLIILLGVVISLGIPFAHAQTFFNKTFTLSGKISGACEYQYEYVYNSTGDIVTGTVSVSAGKIELLILTQSEYNYFAGASGCNVLPASTELTEMITSSYSINYKVPDNNNHYFVFYNIFFQDAIVTATLEWQS